MFQIGRSEAEGANDFTVHGNVHMRKNNYEKFSSPVSRLSCRILCNRETKQVFLFASGFLNQQVSLIELTLWIDVADQYCRYSLVKTILNSQFNQMSGKVSMML